MERKMFFDASPQIFRYAHWLRNHMTPAEKLLWDELRNNKMGLRFKAQHPMMNFIVDFYSYALKLVIEIDGPIHDYKLEYDQQRTEKIEFAGNLVIRFSNEQVIFDMNKVPEVIKGRMNEITIQNQKKILL